MKFFSYSIGLVIFFVKGRWEIFLVLWFYSFYYNYLIVTLYFKSSYR